MRFSQRHGYTPTHKLVQIESIDDELRSALWSSTELTVWRAFKKPEGCHSFRGGSVRDSNFETLVNRLWMNHYRLPVDLSPEHWDDCLAKIREIYFASEWYEVLDFIEFVASSVDSQLSNHYIDACNSKLEEENSAYRFVAGLLAPIANEQEVEEVEIAIGLQVSSS